MYRELKCKVCGINSIVYKSLNGIKNHCIMSHAMLYRGGRYIRIPESSLKMYQTIVRKGQSHNPQLTSKKGLSLTSTKSIHRDGKQSDNSFHGNSSDERDSINDDDSADDDVDSDSTSDDDSTDDQLARHKRQSQHILRQQQPAKLIKWERY